MERIDLRLTPDQILCLSTTRWRALCQLRWSPGADGRLGLDLWIPDPVRADQSLAAGWRIAAALEVAQAEEARAHEALLRAGPP
jgi:hypothetical protein